MDRPGLAYVQCPNCGAANAVKWKPGENPPLYSPVNNSGNSRNVAVVMLIAVAGVFALMAMLVVGVIVLFALGAKQQVADRQPDVRKEFIAPNEEKKDDARPRGQRPDAVKSDPVMTPHEKREREQEREREREKRAQDIRDRDVRAKEKREQDKQEREKRRAAQR